MLLWPILQVTQSPFDFEESPEHQVQAAVQAAPPLRPYNLADAMVLEVAVVDRDVVWSL